MAMELSTYFRINAASTGQFERTLIIADEGSHVSYLEGCTAPMRDENQLHAAIVELVAHELVHGLVPFRVGVAADGPSVAEDKNPREQLVALLSVFLRSTQRQHRKARADEHQDRR